MLAKPTKEQYEWHEMERILFIHFGPATWQGREGDDLSIPPTQIHPHALDTDQWCEVARSWGAKQILYVAKHVGGFCWWQTNTSDYGVKETPWKGGKGDVLADLSQSCRKYGLRLGIYVCPRDDYHKAGNSGIAVDPANQDAYTALYRQQWTEVLSRYGTISEIWFDGNCVIPIADIIAEYAPRAMVFQSSAATIRWGGNEAGYVPYPSWNAVDREILQKGATAADSKPDGNAWAPLEADTTLYEAAWFWSEPKSQTAKSVEQLMEIYYKTVGHGAVLLLNAAPDTSGRIPAADVEIYKQFGEELQRRFANPAAETTNAQGYQIELNLGTVTAIDHAIIMEDYREGERIREYRIEGQLDGSEENWVVLASGSAVGRMKIDRFAKQTVHKARLIIEKSVCEPLIRKFAVYCVDSGKSE